MKLIKAYIRRNMIDKVVHALEAGGFTDMTIIDVKSVRSGIDSKDLDYSLELAERYMNVAKLEIVAQTDRVEKIKEIILTTARTGRRGDGLIYVSPVDEAMHIRTGAQSETGK
ncbi:MAG TPA: P-II family nitrogen regulator [Candidatus Binatia bacterium]|nr:P-II family nitrogen regulator [Candidatus Binatia bacterium]